MMPNMIKDAGMIFSNRKEFSGICDLLFVRIEFAMVSSRLKSKIIKYIVSFLLE